MKMAALERLGKPGILGLGVLLFCLSFYLGHVAPAQLEMTRLQRETARLTASYPASEPGNAVLPPRQLPSFATATDSLKAVYALAERHGLKPERGSYQINDKDGRQRLEASLPLQGSYPSLRAFLHEVLALPAAPALDELVLQRQKSSDTVIEANLRLSIYFAESP